MSQNVNLGELNSSENDLYLKYKSLREIERTAALIEIKKQSLYLWHKISFDEMIDFDRCQMEKDHLKSGKTYKSVIYIPALKSTTSEYDLRDHFGKYGKIVFVKMLNSIILDQSAVFPAFISFFHEFDYLNVLNIIHSVNSDRIETFPCLEPLFEPDSKIGISHCSNYSFEKFIGNHKMQMAEFEFYNKKKLTTKRSNVSVISLSSDDEEEKNSNFESPLLKKLRLEDENRRFSVKKQNPSVIKSSISTNSKEAASNNDTNYKMITGEIDENFKSRMGEHDKKNDIMCVICLRDLEELKSSKTYITSSLCGHLYCEKCVSEFFKGASNKKKPCPTCQKPISKRGFIKLFI
jgi:hypothetical protein